MQNLSGWKDYDNSNKPKIKTNRTNYVYARITDNVGNVTYLSSDGILHDDEKPYIFDITPVMKDRSGSVTFDIFEDGSGLEKVYFLYSTDINEVTSATTENLKASDYHNATGTFTLSDLKPNTEYYCAVLAVDKAGNESYLLNSTFKTLKEAITGTVSISGEAVYGKTLTASYEGLATDAGEVTVSWYRGEDTTAIATGDTYTLTADDVGKVITVKVTAANCSGELTDSTAEVAKAEHPNPPTNGKVDDENNTFTFNGTSGVTYEYSTDGGANWTDVTVDSGTGVGTVTVGNVIVNTGDLQVRAKETDVYKASDVISNTSAYTATLEGSVSLSGAAKYGETLTATVTGAQQGAVLTYTFCADDTVLQQGSSNTYKIEQEAIGKQITVKVSAEGYIGTVNDTSDTVAKAEGVLTLRQTEFTQTFGDEAFELGCSRTGDGTISYKVSDSKKADGTAAGDDNSVIKVSDTGVVTIVGAGSATVTVSLSETKCYTGAAEQTITVTVNKAPKPPKMPGSIMHPAHSKNKVGDVELPQGWAWADSDKEITLEDGKAVTATANYVGSDAGNYKNESVEITLTRSECDHPKTELKNAKPATCKETGYTGDTYCVKCEELVVSGTEIPLGKHQGGKATCTHQAVCTVCGTSYGDLDSSNHTYENGVCKDCSNIWKTTIDDITYQTVTKEENGKPAGQTVTVTVDGQNVEMLAVAVTAVDVNALSQNNSDIFANGTLTIPAKVIDDDAKQTCVVTRINSDVFVQDTEAPVISEVVIPDTVTEVGTGAFTGVATVTFEGATAPAGVKDAISEGTVVQIPDGAKDSYETALEGKGVIKELHTHQYADTWTYDAEYHWHASTCGHDAQDGVLTKEKHTFGEWKEVVAATTTEAGKKERSCVCGYKETADIPKLDVQTPETPSTPAPETPSTPAPGTPSTPAPGTPSTPAPETPSTPVPETPAVKTPKKGDKVSDDKKTGSYIITSSEKKEVAYVAPANKNAKTITIPATIKVKGVTYKVTKIADNCFRNNKKITKITIGKNIVSIGKNAFYGCKKLKTVKMGKNVTTIGANAFRGCTSLTSITLSDKTTKIGTNAFYGCKKLKTITIRSKKLTSKTVSKNAFKGLTKITTIKVPRKKLTAYKKLLKKKGLSSKVKVKGYK